MILPEKNLCCYVEESSVFAPNWLELMGVTYSGERQLSGETFYLWELEQTGSVFNLSKELTPSIGYYADKSEKRIPRRFTTSVGEFILDFWTNTYS